MSARRPSATTDPARVRRLIDAARAGERTALDELLSRHLPHLGALARRRLGGGQGGLRPSDLVQDTAERAVRSFATFQGNSDPEVQGWMETILQNLLVQHHRANSRKKRAAAQGAVSIEELSSEIPSASESPSQLLAGKRAIRKLLAAVFALPPAQQGAVRQYLRGASISEIAAALEKTPAAVSCLLQRATLKLQQDMGDLAGVAPRPLRAWLQQMRAVFDAADE